MSVDVSSAEAAAERFDALGHPVHGYDEVIPGLAQADTTYSPLELFELGFDAIFDLPAGTEARAWRTVPTCSS